MSEIKIRFEKLKFEIMNITYAEHQSRCPYCERNNQSDFEIIVLREHSFDVLKCSVCQTFLSVVPKNGTQTGGESIDEEKNNDKTDGSYMSINDIKRKAKMNLY